MPKSKTPRRSSSIYINDNTGINTKANSKRKRLDGYGGNTSTPKEKQKFDAIRRGLVGDNPRVKPNTLGAGRTSAPSRADEVLAREYAKEKAKKAKASRATVGRNERQAKKKK